jgi:glucokinase
MFGIAHGVVDLSRKKYLAGVDLGGTWVRVVLSDLQGHFVQKVNEKVDKTRSEAVSAQLVRLVRFLCKKHGVDVQALKGVGIASAGPLDMKRGILVKPPNLPFDSVKLTEPLKEAFGVPTCLVNDCVAAALGETTFGTARGIENFVYITISTGIGAGAIVNGTLLLGKDGNSHEVGHFVIDYQGRLTCGCGRKGHWEAYCSGRNMPNYVRMRFEETGPKTFKTSILCKQLRGDLSKLRAADMFSAARRKDKLALALVAEIGVLNAIGFANVTNAYDPSLVTVGGTVTLKNVEAVLVPIRKHVGDYAINRVPEIKVTSLGENVGVYGAVAAALKYLS